jgi:hypothetical protein
MNRPHENNARFFPIATYLRLLWGTALILFSLAAPTTLQADTCESKWHRDNCL